MNEATYSKRDKEIAKKYRKELSLSFVLYVIVLLVSITYAKPMADSLLRTLIVMTPVIPAFGALWAIVRNFKRMDDYVRVWLLEVVAISGAITAFFSFSYGFLEGIGFPKLSGFVTYGIFMGSWCLIIGVRKILEREK